jgi:hypothetical protein
MSSKNEDYFTQYLKRDESNYRLNVNLEELLNSCNQISVMHNGEMSDRKSSMKSRPSTCKSYKSSEKSKTHFTVPLTEYCMMDYQDIINPQFPMNGPEQSAEPEKTVRNIKAKQISFLQNIRRCRDLSLRYKKITGSRQDDCMNIKIQSKQLPM